MIEAAELETAERTQVAPEEATRTRKQPPYAVILHNDDVNGFDYVVGVLRKVFGFGLAKSLHLTLAAHFRGRSLVWLGRLEVAELKADQIRSCGPDPAKKSKGALALRVSIEPMEG
jgi:ATP-dependent Clp protease adaptor protein ClpS